MGTAMGNREDATPAGQPGDGAQRPDLDRLVEITRDQLPPEVEEARRSPEAIFGKYILLQELGRGGSGYVRKAWDTILGRPVALKYIHVEPPSAAPAEAPLAEDQRIRNLILEARVASRLRHPHIASVYDVARAGDQYYISMELIEGESLHSCLYGARGRGWISPLYEEPAHFLQVLCDIASAVDYAHTHKPPVIHCDLKPSNVLLDAQKNAFVVDFSLARVLQKGKNENIGVRGTPAYMAPEQLHGRSSDLGSFTDVYGLGALLYVMLTGSPPFGGTAEEIMADVERKTPVRPSVRVRAQRKSAERTWESPLLPHLYALEEICQKCLAKRPEDRYRSAGQVHEELREVLGLLRPEPASPAEASPDAPELSKAPESGPPETDAASRERVTAFRNRLSLKINSARPTVADFTRRGSAEGTVQLLKATPDRVYILRRGVVQTLDWPSLPSSLAVTLAETVGMAAPEDRLALGILSLNEGLKEESTKFFDSLKGTPLEKETRRFKKGEDEDELLR